MGFSCDQPHIDAVDRLHQVQLDAERLFLGGGLAFHVLDHQRAAMLEIGVREVRVEAQRGLHAPAGTNAHGGCQLEAHLALQVADFARALQQPEFTPAIGFAFGIEHDAVAGALDVVVFAHSHGPSPSPAHALSASPRPSSISGAPCTKAGCDSIFVNRETAAPARYRAQCNEDSRSYSAASPASRWPSRIARSRGTSPFTSPPSTRSSGVHANARPWASGNGLFSPPCHGVLPPSTQHPKRSGGAGPRCRAP